MKQTGTVLLFTLLFGILEGNAQLSVIDEVSAPYLTILIQTAKDNYPRNKIYAKEIGIAHSNLNKARLSWFDGLGVYYLYLPPTVAGGTVNPSSNRSGAFQFGFSFNIGSLLQKPAQIKATKGEWEVTQLNKAEYDLTIEASVKERYYRYVQQLTLLKQSTQLVLDAQTILTYVRNKFEKEQETFENYYKALALYNQQNQEKIRVETELLISKAHLEELLNKKLEELQEVEKVK